MLNSDSCGKTGERSADTTKVLDIRLKDILEKVRLNYLLERDESGWDAKLNWEDTLSLGEQQRLGMVSKVHVSAWSDIHRLNKSVILYVCFH